jgi:hypothetical protein
MTDKEKPNRLSIGQQIWVSQEISKWYMEWKKKAPSDPVKKEVGIAMNDLRNILCELNSHHYTTVESLLKIDQACEQLQNRCAATE